MEEQETTFVVDGTEYELKYPEKRVEMAEASMGDKSIVEVFSTQPTLREIKTAAAYGLREVGQSAWVNPTKAIDIAGRALEELGRTSLMTLIADAVMRDCAFLFQEN
ncbi:MAG: hypothetical protein LKF44_08250 [Atopobiaceae bacterium]|jgi:hypothetical protein|nr:hypothetical protein [Atopobiaceae bacterium]